MIAKKKYGKTKNKKKNDNGKCGNRWKFDETQTQKKNFDEINEMIIDEDETKDGKKSKQNKENCWKHKQTKV